MGPAARNNGEVAIFHLANRLFLAVVDFLFLHHLPDAVDDFFGLRLRTSQIRAFFQSNDFKRVQFLIIAQGFVIFIAVAICDPFLLIVDAVVFFSHDVAENLVDFCDNGLS